MTSAAPVKPDELYLGLLKKTLLNETGLEAELRIAYLHDCAVAGTPLDRTLMRDIRLRWPERFAALAERRRIGAVGGEDVIALECAYTMSGRVRLDYLHRCLEQVVEEGIPGDVLEAGVWRGGSAIFAKAFLQARGITGRRVLLADTFCGVPPAHHPADAGVTLSDMPHLAIARALVEDAFRRFDLWDDSVVLIEGDFAHTLANAPVERLAILRLDGDLFSSTVDTLTALYDKVAPGGFVIVDDYGALPGCRFAVEAFRLAKSITAPLEVIDWTAVAWRKT